MIWSTMSFGRYHGKTHYNKALEQYEKAVRGKSRVGKGFKPKKRK